MRVEFTAVLAHGGKAPDLQNLATELGKGDFAYVSEIIAATRSQHSDSKNWNDVEGWTWMNEPLEDARTEWSLGSALSLEGPAGFLLDFYPHTWTLFHSTSWADFLTQQPVRDRLRRACRELSARFGRERAIYIPDSAWPPSEVTRCMADGSSLKGIEDWLAENCGPPAETIESIYSTFEDSWDGDGYYIDTFTDLGR